jgi:pSer/pThr/pTyr-binding forkhead associated (FHA) protein
MKVTLVVQMEGKQGRTFTLRSPGGIIGRMQGNSVRIPSNDVSRQHCRLGVGKEMVTVEDLKSVNGTFINGKRIEGVRKLRSGDRLGVGPVTFLVAFDAADKVETDEEIDVELLTGPELDQAVVDEPSSEGLDVFADLEPVRPKRAGVPTQKNAKLSHSPQEEKKPAKKRRPLRDDAPIPLVGADDPEDAPIPLVGGDSKESRETINVELDQGWVPPEPEAFRDLLLGLEDGEKVDGD